MIIHTHVKHVIICYGDSVAESKPHSQFRLGAKTLAIRLLEMVEDQLIKANRNRLDYIKTMIKRDDIESALEMCATLSQ